MSKLSEEDAKFLYVNGFKPSKVSPPTWIKYKRSSGPNAILRFVAGNWLLRTYDEAGWFTDYPFAADNPVKLVIWAKLEGIL